MDFRNISNQDLIARLEKLTHTERKITHLILLHIQEIEARKIFLQLGFESLYSYLTKGLKYSDSAAYRRIQAARLLSAVPTSTQDLLTEKLESGALNLSQLTQVHSCLKDQKKCGRSIAPQKVSEILQAIEGKNTFDSQKVLAKKFNMQIKKTEQAKPQQDDSVRVELTFSKEQFADLQLAKSLLSHQCPTGQWSEVITLLAKKLNQSRLGKNTGLHTTEKSEVKSDSQGLGAENVPGDTSVVGSGTTVRRQVFMKAQNKCEFRAAATGVRCESLFQLEIHHKKPLALGGSHDVENLRVLCKQHNKLAWQQSLGAC